MKKLLLGCFLCTIALNSMAVNNIAKIEEGYVGIFYSKEEEKPIASPIIYKNANQCESEMKKLADIAVDTVKIKRKYLCTPVLVLK